MGVSVFVERNLVMLDIHYLVQYSSQKECMDKLKELLKDYGDGIVNKTDKDGNTPLIIASKYLNVSVNKFAICYLLLYGADKFIKNNEGKSCMDYCNDDLLIEWDNYI